MTSLFVFFVWSGVTTAAQVGRSLLPGELIIPPPPRAHVQIPRVLQRWPPWRSQRAVGGARQGNTNCPLMRLFRMPGQGPAGQVSSKCLWRQRSRTKSRVAKFKEKKQLLIEQIRWYRGFADTMTHGTHISCISMLTTNCEICNCIAVKFVTHVLEKSCWGMCGEKNPTTKCNGFILFLSKCNKHTASRAAAPADSDSAHSTTWLTARPLGPPHRWTPAECWEAQWLIGRCVDT